MREEPEKGRKGRGEVKKRAPCPCVTPTSRFKVCQGGSEGVCALTRRRDLRPIEQKEVKNKRPVLYLMLGSIHYRW